MSCRRGHSLPTEGSFERAKTEYLQRPDVHLGVSPGTRRRIEGASPKELPLDGYLFACECGAHRGEIFIDMYYRGPELPIGNENWTLLDGAPPAEMFAESAPCPYGGKELRTHVHRRESKKS